MTRLECSDVITQRYVTDTQSALFTVKVKFDGYRHGFGLAKQHRGGLDALLCRLPGRLVDYTSLADSVQAFPCQQRNREFIVYPWATFAAFRKCIVRIRSTKSKVVGTHSSTLCQNASPILMHLNGHLVALASGPSVTTSHDPLGPDETPLHSQLVILSCGGAHH